MRLTVGPLPPAVYWRRRALVLGAILLVLFLVAQACMAASASSDRDSAGESTEESPTPPATDPPGGSGEPAPPTGGPSSPAVPPAASQDPPGLADEEDLGEAGCTDEELLVVAVAEATSLAPGAGTELTVRFRNDSDRTCRRDVGPGRRELFLRTGSGDLPVWSSRDCQDLRGRDVRELPPGIDFEHYISWNGRASDDCDGVAPAGEVLGPGEYELVARVGTAYSDPVTVTVTGSA